MYRDLLSVAQERIADNSLKRLVVEILEANRERLLTLQPRRTIITRSSAAGWNTC